MDKAGVLWGDEFQFPKGGKERSNVWISTISSEFQFPEGGKEGDNTRLDKER